MPDRASRPGEGNGQHYELPDEYGPARQPRREAPSADAVIVHAPGQTALLEAIAEAAEADPDPLTRQQVVASAPRKRSPWLRRSIVIAVVLVLIPVGISYANALTAPGTDSLSIRTVEWVRDHGGNGIVNTIERWWYTNNPPPEGGRPSEIGRASCRERV